MSKRCKKCGCELERGVCLNCGNEGMWIPKGILLVVGFIAVVVLLVVLAR